MSPQIVVITNFSLNHNPKAEQEIRRHPIDPRLLKFPDKYLFYITDDLPQDAPLPAHSYLEAQIDPLLHQAGKKHLAEWSFLLAEAKHSFCSYPFFMISSRFYMKNAWLRRDLNEEWDDLFSYFEKYSHGFLPSYSRPMRWVHFSQLMNNPRVFFPFTANFSSLVKRLYNIDLVKDYPVFPDLGCNYLGFKNRQALLDYVTFYEPIFEFFFHSDFSIKNPIENYAIKSGFFPNEKPLTFVLETLSHLYFAKREKPFFALHYDGYYEVDLKKRRLERFKKFSLPLFLQWRRKIRYRLWWLNTEGSKMIPPFLFPVLRPLVRGIKRVRKAFKFQ